MTAIAITKEEYNRLFSQDLSEIFEMHARGYLIEAVYVGHDDFNGVLLACGLITGRYRGDECYNVTCIGAAFTYDDEAEYYRIEGQGRVAVDAALKFATDKLAARPLNARV